MKKILILGSSGSGKTYLGEIISKKLKIKQYDLDDIQYKRRFDVIRSKEEKIKLMDKLTRKPSWIITGVRYSWMDSAIERADKIIMLKRNVLLESYRVTKRFIKRKFGPNPPKETLKDLYGLIKWNYQSFHTKKGEHVLRHKKICRKHKKTVLMINSSNELNKFISSLNK